MLSIIPGYEYNIFISYRQKDNKHDGWVTEFVNNLKGELESTFKEDISVYFDINPHDGLLETHDVDASLKEKLKCLIFIPVISQTYCDPKSFAWQHEFVAFNTMSKEDQFGRDIRLYGGNVASRILPIKIHDLDQEDKALLENELGGVLRSIDFIYKSAGVNRPLRANEDHPQDNLNKTYYRDQINKVANAVKEIITALKKYDQKDGSILIETGRTEPERTRKLKSKFIILPFIILTTLLTGYFLIPKFIKLSEPVIKSVAVLPFADLSNDESQSWLTGITDVIINQLSKISEFRVLPRSSTFKYKENNGNKSASEIGKELGVDFILDGSVQKQENQIRIAIQLIEVRGEELIWSEIYDKKWGEIFNIQTDIAKSIASSLKTKLSPEEASQIGNIGTESAEAYRLYLIGNSLMVNPQNSLSGDVYRNAVEYFRQSIAIDSGFARAYAGLASAYLELAGWMVSSPSAEYIPLARECASKALEIDGKHGEAYFILGKLYYIFEWDWVEAEQAFMEGMELSPAFIYGRIEYANFLSAMGRFDKSITLGQQTLKLDPTEPTVYNELAYSMTLMGQYNEALDLLNKSLELYPDLYQTLELRKYLYHSMGNFNSDILVWGKIKGSYKNDLSKVEFYDLIAAGKALVKVGRQSEASEILNEINRRTTEDFSPPPVDMGYFYLALGEYEKGMDFFETAYNEKQPGLVWINVDFRNDSIRSNPRFKRLLRKMGFEKE